MIRADIPQDVTEYKEQFFLGMTGRQILCVVLMLVLAVGTFLIGKNFVTTDILVYLIVLEVAPLAAVGFLKYNGMECIECGTCNYICPANRNITQSVRTMKRAIIAERKKG